jgi:hypothetical protein
MEIRDYAGRKGISKRKEILKEKRYYQRYCHKHPKCQIRYRYRFKLHRRPNSYYNKYNRYQINI